MLDYIMQNKQKKNVVTVIFNTIDITFTSQFIKFLNLYGTIYTMFHK